MKNNTLLSVRSNCDFSLDYQKGTLHPKAEVILITTAPKYVLNKKKDAFAKEAEVSEYRFISGLEGINQLIGELQLLVKNMNSFEQTASSLNAIIKPNQTENP
jgi:hypothetical protein